MGINPEEYLFLLFFQWVAVLLQDIIVSLNRLITINENSKYNRNHYQRKYTK
jgi:hypothetical protein